MRENRLNKLKEKMEEASIDAVVLFSDSDIKYFCDINVEGVFVLIKDEVKLFVSSLYFQKAQEKLKEDAVLSNSLDNIIEYLQSNKIKNIGLDFAKTTVKQLKAFEGFNIIDFSNQTLTIRAIKEKEEINNIKRAALIARNALLKVYPTIKTGITEKELADELAYQLRKNGAEKEAFDTIVASGPNAAYPHHKPTDRKIKEGEFVVIDFGASIDGYNSDTTYTFLIGEKTDELKELFNAVFYAQLFATEMIAPGRTTAKQIDARAREELAKRNLDKYFIHSTGHGVGLDVHEFPFLNPTNDMVIQPNMIFTIEPGIYIPNKLGIRLEHMVLVHENDTEVLAFAPFVEAM
ncbi:M24 family metallopeptidase [Hippea maritima]|uniref:Peptidase M24 n=1 Tax=Hippea maritima (strain ATCC 700847 / DSM 10411 / MH2) TaxID=760142 RepID=F2LV84_HIPMA|nr:aminopeptidase P family protein [Hippea maritima]AEA33668.1 peptidase M24 [Hippea maritima DSM 10411]